MRPPLALTVVTALAVGLVVGPPAWAATPSPLDAIVADLRGAGVHVSPRVLGEASADAAHRLLTARTALATERIDVAFVIVPGPVASPGMTSLARTLHRRAELTGTLLVTAPGRPVVFWGIAPRPPVSAAIAASGANQLANPVDRLTRAAEGAVPPGPEPSGTRQLLALLLLAVLGGGWAAAIGARGTDRRRRVALTEGRAHLRVWLDALRSQAMVAAGSHLTPPRRLEVEAVLALCSDTLTGLHTARTADDVRTLAPRVHEGFATLAGVTGVPAGDPFAGLCATDPAHGRAVPVQPGADPAGPDGPPLCRDCRAAVANGTVPAVRQVPVGNRLAPYTAVLHDGPYSRPDAPPDTSHAPLNA